MSLGQAIVRAIGAVVSPDSMVGSALRRFVGRPIATALSWADESINGVLRGILPFAEHRMALLAVLALVAVIAVSAVFWNETEQVRNIGLAVAAIIALPVAIWRSRVAERQATAAQKQVETTSQQLEIAHEQVQAAQRQVQATLQGQLNQRYEKGSEMLGSDVLAVRIGGIYNLQRLAEEDPTHYHIPIARLFCAFVRNPPSGASTDRRGRRLRVTLRDDVQTVLDWLGRNRQVALEEEHGPDHLLNLRDAALQGVSLGEDMDLSRADLSGADLSEAQSLDGLNLSQALLNDARLVNADFTNADLSNAHFAGAMCEGLRLDGANVSAAEFSFFGATPAEGLTQPQLDRARADAARPPGLRGVRDAETTAQLLWRSDGQS